MVSVGVGVGVGVRALAMKMCVCVYAYVCVRGRVFEIVRRCLLSWLDWQVTFGFLLVFLT